MICLIDFSDTLTSHKIPHGGRVGGWKEKRNNTQSLVSAQSEN